MIEARPEAKPNLSTFSETQPGRKEDRKGKELLPPTSLIYALF